MARLLACWELGGGMGHIAGLAPAAAALAALGHESWLAALDVAVAEPPGRWPFQRVLPAPLWPHRSATFPTLSFGQVIADGGFADAGGLAALVRAWLDLFDLVAPAAIYGDHAPASLLAAHVAGLPAARLGTPFTCPPAARPMPALMPWLSVSADARAAADVVADRVVQDVCRGFGAPVLAGLAELLATARPFLISWPETDGQDRDDSAWYGPVTGLGAAAAPDWPVVDGPQVLVFLPFGRAAAAPLAEALGLRGWPVVWMCPSPPPFKLPANIRHESELVAIRGGTDGPRLLVGRASHSINLAALRSGVPQLLLPDDVETRTMAVALAARQLGRLPDAWTAAAIGPLLDALVRDDAPERAAAAAVAARYAGYDPAAMAGRLGRDLAAALGLG